MGVRVSQYGKEMDKSKKGESLRTRHKKAVKRSSVKTSGKETKPGKLSEKSLIKKTKRRLKELFYGERTYLPGHKKPKTGKKTNRTKRVEGGLKAAGLSASDIAKLRGKK